MNLNLITRLFLSLPLLAASAAFTALPAVAMERMENDSMMKMEKKDSMDRMENGSMMKMEKKDSMDRMENDSMMKMEKKESMNRMERKH